MSLKSLSMTLFLALFASTSFAQVADEVWAEADNLYVQRADGQETVKQARIKYKEILSQSTTQLDKDRSAMQLARLAVYEGEMLLSKSDRDGRKAVFRECWDGSTGFTKAISRDHPGYYYFRGICLAYWGEAAGTLASLPHVRTLVGLLDSGLEMDTRFEGGGILRLAAGIHSNSAARPLGLYKPQQAVDEINSALEQDAYPGDANDGQSYYDNHYMKAKVLNAVGRTDEAQTVLEDTLEELEELIDDDELPEGRAPETMFYYENIKLILEGA